LAVTWKQLGYISDIVYGAGWNGVTNESPSKNVIYDEMETKSSKTTAAWSKSIGSGGDYATWAAMIADMPDLIAHAVTVTIKAGTTLTETCNLKNKHGLTNEAQITIRAEKYFPSSGSIPTADSATATTLRDAALATAVLGNDYFNGCWVFIVHGTGTDNGFVPITDYVDATGDVVVASWPGTQPDNTSRYLIVGALIDGEGARKCFDLSSNLVAITFNGIGFDSSNNYNSMNYCTDTSFYYCGVYNNYYSGIQAVVCQNIFNYYCGIVKNNTSDNAGHGGIYGAACNRVYCYRCGISDNKQRGVYIGQNSFGYISQCFGDTNGTWGVYCNNSGQAKTVAPECSGSSGNHSDPGTAGTASADQASAY
jgi:hypothetical protein